MQTSTGHSIQVREEVKGQKAIRVQVKVEAEA
jgi:hypothetical protein